MIALGLDLSKTRTGWAMDALAGGGPPRMGSLPRVADTDRLLHEFAVWLNATIKAHEVTHVALEAPLYGGAPLTAEIGEALIGLATHAMSVCYFRGVPLYKPGSQTVRKYFLGEGRPVSPKQAVMARCQQLGWSPANHDEADAAATWAWCKANHDRSFVLLPGAPLFRNARVTA